MATGTTFGLFTTTRYDPILLGNEHNDKLAFSTPCPFYMLKYHTSRVQEAAKYFGFSPILSTLEDGHAFQAQLLEKVEAYQRSSRIEDGPMKVRVEFSPDGAVKFDFGPVPAVSLEELYPTTFNLPDDENAVKPMEISPLTGGALTSSDSQVNSDSTKSQRVVTPIKASYEILINPDATAVTPHLSYKSTYRRHYDLARQWAWSFETRNAALTDKEVLLHNPEGKVMECSVSTPYLFRNGRWVTPPLTLEHGGQIGTTRRWVLSQDYCAEEVVRKDSLQVGEAIWISNGLRGFHWGYILKESA